VVTGTPRDSLDRTGLHQVFVETGEKHLFALGRGASCLLHGDERFAGAGCAKKQLAPVFLRLIQNSLLLFRQHNLGLSLESHNFVFQ